jgi:hypothetical protein
MLGFAVRHAVYFGYIEREIGEVAHVGLLPAGQVKDRLRRPADPVAP